MTILSTDNIACDELLPLRFLLFVADTPASQLALLYVANEVLIKCTKYGVPEFKDVFPPFVIEAMKHLRPGNLVSKLTKLFKYWLHYKLFEPKFVQQLLNGLTTSEQKKGRKFGDESSAVTDDPLNTFQPEKLTGSLLRLKQIEDEVETKFKTDVSAIFVDVPISNIVSSLKTKSESRALSQQVDICCKNLETSIKKRVERLDHLRVVNELLQAAESYYEAQHKEVVVVMNVRHCLSS
ncbi:hypothetical protein AHF37_08525 [Paragonimus kellicotti]|nr:hypothetical protein AHF37_08525 [Paragonimus kellicotti]